MQTFYMVLCKGQPVYVGSIVNCRRYVSVAAKASPSVAPYLRIVRVEEAEE